MIIYKITNLVNNKVYIGQTTRTLSQRISNHKLYPNSLISQAFKKYGFENFEVAVIDNANTKEELDKKEQYWIEYYECISPRGYNLSKGGGGTKGYKLSKETKMKISKANRGKPSPMKGKSLTLETRRKISEARKGKYTGKNNPMYGRRHSIETIEKIRKKAIGKKRSAETRKAISNGHIGLKMSEETKRKLSEVMPTKRMVENLDTGAVFNSITEAANFYGLRKSDIVQVCKGRRKRTGGYRWRYVN